MISRFLAFLAGALVTLSVIDPALLGTRVDALRESLVERVKSAGDGTLDTMRKSAAGTMVETQHTEKSQKPRELPIAEPAVAPAIEETVEHATGKAADEAARPTAEVAQDGSAVPAQDVDSTRPDPLQVRRTSEDAVERWQAVWSPFRSELSARGFSNRLTRQTGIPLEVIRESRGVYQVAFAYTDEAGRENLLARLRNAAGLGEASL